MNEVIKQWKKIAQNHSIDTIRNALSQIKSPGILITDLIQEYIERKKHLADGTIKKLSCFINIYNKRFPELIVPVRSINVGYCDQLYNKLLESMNVNSAAKRMSQLSSFLKFAMQEGYTNHNPINLMTFKKVKTRIVFLTKKELKKMRKVTLIKSLDQVRDVFIFACNTGAEFSRLENLKWDNIQKGEDGGLWMISKRIKTNKFADVPLNKHARKILEKYKNYDKEYCLPVMSNQHTNECLKTIAAICQIDKSIHTHMARHTFATTVCLLKGISGAVTAEMMGISERMLRDRYGVIVKGRISNEFRKIYD